MHDTLNTLTDTELDTVLNALVSRAAECDDYLRRLSEGTLHGAAGISVKPEQYWQEQKELAWNLWHKLYRIKHYDGE